MQKILYTHQIEQYEQFIDADIIAYLQLRQTHSFECFADYDLFAFEWYDIDHPGSETSQILIYIDREDLFIFCEDDRVYEVVEAAFQPEESNEHALYAFFVELLKSDRDYLEQYETIITDEENEALAGNERDYYKKIIAYRKELLRLKRYYDQLDDIMDHLAANDNQLFSNQGVRRFIILGSRTERFRSFILNLRDYVTQMREAYQAQIDIEQNNLMRIFTVLTAVFLPLTLMVGWYGMNFVNMPELSWKYGYYGFAGVSAMICIILLIFFKKKRWF